MLCPSHEFTNSRHYRIECMQTYTTKAVKFENKARQTVHDTLTVEAPLQITINSAPFTITMRTPGADTELVTGLLFTENIIATPSDYQLQERLDPQRNIPYMINIICDLPETRNGALNDRSILSVSSCGICGKRSLSDLHAEGAPLATDIRIGASCLEAMFGAMHARQRLFHQSGGSHAAAAFTRTGELLALFEDIGRHNAVDKVIGAMLRSGELDRAHCLLVSGRVSFEIVTKTFMAGIPVLAAVSAPSSMAVETAGALGITLVAFCRDGKATVYTHTSRIVEENKECQKT